MKDGAQRMHGSLEITSMESWKQPMLIRSLEQIVTIVCAAACIILYLVSRKVEPSKAEIQEAFKKSCDAISARHNKELEEMIAEEEIAVAADAVERAAAAAEDEIKK